jgi:hypothetical protein
MDDHKFQKELAWSQILITTLIAFGTTIVAIGLTLLNTPFGGASLAIEIIGIVVIIGSVVIGFIKLKKL